jgi:hypothetical protein
MKWDLRPVLSKYLLRERVDFTLEHDIHAGSFKAKVKTADSCEKGSYTQRVLSLWQRSIEGPRGMARSPNSVPGAIGPAPISAGQTIIVYQALPILPE